MLPNLIIIGAMKCGTTSLHYYLDQHPQVSMSRVKEINFFVTECQWHRGVEWYASHFSGKAAVRGEACTNYTKFPFWAGVPQRMHSVIPDARLIYIVGDPIKRILSHYVQRYAWRQEERSLPEALSGFADNPYVTRSRYFMQLEQYLEYYPPSSILVITKEDLYAKRLATLQTVFRFLEVDASFTSPRFSQVRHPSSAKRRLTRAGVFLARLPGMRFIDRPPHEERGWVEKWIYRALSRGFERPTLAETLRQELADHLREDVRQLKEYTGREFEDWRL
jgi:sulfotransferase family protein